MYVNFVITEDYQKVLCLIVASDFIARLYYIDLFFIPNSTPVLSLSTYSIIENILSILRIEIYALIHIRIHIPFIRCRSRSPG